MQHKRQLFMLPQVCFILTSPSCRNPLYTFTFSWDKLIRVFQHVYTLDSIYQTVIISTLVVFLAKIEKLVQVFYSHKMEKWCHKYISNKRIFVKIYKKNKKKRKCGEVLWIIQPLHIQVWAIPLTITSMWAERSSSSSSGPSRTLSALWCCFHLPPLSASLTAVCVCVWEVEVVLGFAHTA